MTETVYDIYQIKNLLTPIFIANNVRRAMLFGSYGRGDVAPKSDIDLFVDSGLRGLEFVGLLETITRAVDKNVDLIDATHIESGSPIEREIESTGVVLYEI
ncbi:MAG: nucleotidyltransferase domain-containing protein [Coriobacteriales bacterium]|jgi:predicted nucleotidyltransferase|nr:nucleotidyltransferase domain-containing protein [Coriobacteriales bacterium]